MEVKYINPFMTAVSNTMEMMLGIAPGRQAPYLKKDKLTKGDITGLIGFAEKNVTGSVALSFTQDAALWIYQLMTGEEQQSLTRDVQDSIGELTNIVAGGAKTALAEEGLSFHISIPSVIVGKDHLISHKLNIPVVAIPFKLEDHTFLMEVSMKVLGKNVAQ